MSRRRYRMCPRKFWACSIAVTKLIVKESKSIVSIIEARVTKSIEAVKASMR
jgi:hypothetical protein